MHVFLPEERQGFELRFTNKEITIMDGMGLMKRMLDDRIGIDSIE